MKIALALVLLVAWTRCADACGVWYMADKEKGLDVKWLITSGHILKGKKQIAALYLDIDAKPAPRVATGRTVLFDFVRGKLRKRGKVIGTLDGDTITIGKKTFTMSFGAKHDAHDFPAWDLTVTRGDDVILETTEASALCAPMHHEGMSEADQLQDIRLHIAYYLAWREVGAGG